MTPSTQKATAESIAPHDLGETLAPVLVDEPDTAASYEDAASVAQWKLPENLAWSVLKNSAAQVVGRVLIALCRLVVASLIVRTFGKSLFGEYSLVFGVLMIADWLVDFGTTEVFVREICREPQRSQRLLRILTATKGVQIPLAFAAVAGLFFALRYPADVVMAGLVGGVNIIFFAGVLVYRVIFKSTLTMEREVAAEFISVIALIPLIALVCLSRGSLMALVSCYVVSRAVYCGACFLFGKAKYRPAIAGVSFHDITSGLRSSAAIGVIGFLVGGYETLDILLLSKLGSFSQVAYYSAAQKLMWPMLMALAAVGATFYPIVASYWPHSREKFEASSQRSLDIVLVLAGIAVCSILAGAKFFMGLLGPDLVSGANVLKVLAFLCLVKAVTSTVGPILYIVKAQNHALRFIAVAVAVKAAVIAALIPRYGYMGVAVGALVVEVCFAAIPAVYLVHRHSGYYMRWSVGFKVIVLVVLTAWLTRLLPTPGGFVAAIVAPVVYVPLVFVTGAARWSEVRSLVERAMQ